MHGVSLGDLCSLAPREHFTRYRISVRLQGTFAEHARFLAQQDPQFVKQLVRSIQPAEEPRRPAETGR
jgi:hypothetical protein